MGHVNPFETFDFQKFSNNISNFSIQWVSTPAIWESIGTPIPKMGAHSLTLSYTLGK